MDGIRKKKQKRKTFKIITDEANPKEVFTEFKLIN